MQKFLFYSLICLANVSAAYALPTGARASSVKSVANTTSVLPQKNTTQLASAPTSLSNKTTTITSNSKSKETSADTERFGSAKTIKSNFPSKITVPSSSSSSSSNTSSSEIERLHNQIEVLQAQIDQLQSELSRKAETDEVNQIQRELANKAETVDVVELNEAITEAKQDTERKLDQFKQESGASQYLTLDKLNNAIANKEIMQDFAKKDEVAAAKREAISTVNSDITDKIVNLNTAFNEKLRNYATNEKVFNDIAVAKGEAIAVADQDSREKFANINSNISEDAIKTHFDKFLNAEVKNQNGKFKDFLTNTDKEILEDAIDDAIVEAVAVAGNSADNKFVKSDKLSNELRSKIDIGFLAEKGILTGETLDNELIKKGIDKATLIADIKSAKDGAIDAATADADDKISLLDKRITNIASGQIDEDGLKIHFDRFLDTELGKGERFVGFVKADDITANELEKKLSDRFAHKNDLVGLTKDSELTGKIGGILDLELKNETGRFKDFASKYDLIGLAKDSELSDKFIGLLDTELGKTGGKFKDFANKSDLLTDADLNSKILTLENFKGLSDRIAANADKFKNYTDNDNLNTKIATLQNFKDLSGTVSGHTTTLGGLNDTIDTRINGKGFLTANSSTITGLDSRIAANADKFKNYTDNDNLNTKIATLQNFKDLSGTVSGHTTTLGGLNDTIDTRINSKGFLTADSSTITGLTGRISATETALSDDNLNAKLANLSNFTNLQTRLSTAELNIDDLDLNIVSTNSAVQALNSGTVVPRRAIRRTTAASSDDEEP